jgi:hypothetical protein
MTKIEGHAMTTQQTQTPVEVHPELTRRADGTFLFEAGGVAIVYPLESSCGRFNVTPADYGFECESTGGGFTAWIRRFTWEGQDVAMVITDEHGESHDIKPQAPVMIGVHPWGDSGVGIEWVQRPDTIDGEYIEPSWINERGL